MTTLTLTRIIIIIVWIQVNYFMRLIKMRDTSIVLYINYTYLSINYIYIRNKSCTVYDITK
jgi:hypothetical protein